MARIVYLLRKPPPSSTIKALADHGTGAINVKALLTPSGSWPPNVVLEHEPTCAQRDCERGCPVRALAEHFGRQAPDRFLVAGTPEPPPRPPWMG